jgi:hypothetical protein
MTGMPVHVGEAIPEVVTGWLVRWLGHGVARALTGRFAPWTAERLVAFGYLAVDIAARELVPVVFELLGRNGDARRLRSLPVIADPTTAAQALLLLDVEHPGLERPLFLSSVYRAIADVAAADEAYRRTGELDLNWLASVFDNAAALDMAMGRSRTVVGDRLDVPALFQSALLARGLDA